MFVPPNVWNLGSRGSAGLGFEFSKASCPFGGGMSPSKLRETAYRLDPVLWVRDILGVTPTAW